MAKRVSGFEVETEYIEWGVELGTENGERIVVECGDDADAYETFDRNPGSKIVARRVFETGWAEVPDAPDI